MAFRDIRSWGTIRVEILEMERLRPMSPEPSSSQIIHMAFVILAFSSAGILTRDLNKHNWGIRRFSSDGVIQELVAIDGADWHQEGGPTLSSPRRRLESWWKWIEGVDPATVFWLRNQVERYHQDHAQLATALLQRLQVPEAGCARKRTLQKTTQQTVYLQQLGSLGRHAYVRYATCHEHKHVQEWQG